MLILLSFFQLRLFASSGDRYCELRTASLNWEPSNVCSSRLG